MPPTPKRNMYRIKATDSATTIPGRLTFPKGTYISNPDPTSIYRPMYGGMNQKPYQMGTGTPASGLSGQQGAPSAMNPTRPFQGVPSQFYKGQSLNYSADMRGRGYGSPPPAGTPSNLYAPLGVPYSELPRPGFVALPQLPSEQNPLTPPGFVETPIGTGSEEFMNTKFMQKNVENNVAFTNQLRWDPDRKKYVQLGKLIKEGRLNMKTGKLSKKKGRGGGGEEPAYTPAPAPVAQPVQQTVQLPSITSQLVSFRA